MKTSAARWHSAMVLLAVLLPFPAASGAVESLIVESLKGGCLFAYLPDDNLFIPKIEFTPKCVKEPHALVLGLQASPTKSMPEQWRAQTTTMPG